MPRLPAAGAGRKADPAIISYLHFPEAPPCGRGASLTLHGFSCEFLYGNVEKELVLPNLMNEIFQMRTRVKFVLVGRLRECPAGLPSSDSLTPRETYV